MEREIFLQNKIKESGFNKKDFAAYIDMPYSTLLSILKSVGGASLDNVIKICNGLNLSIEMLNPYIENMSNGLFNEKYNKLNNLGKEKADEYIEVLSENKKYTVEQPLISNSIANELKQDVTALTKLKSNL